MKSSFARNNIGLILLVLTVLVCLVQVMRTQQQLDPPGKKVIRIAFWQLEAGYREAMQAMIDEYQKLHPDVVIRQMPITERLYAQWLNVHLIAGDAPDLCEMGMATLTNTDQPKIRYFTPLAEPLDQPNPYNVGTQFEKLAWRETFIDGNRGQFSDSLQEYFAVPTSFYGAGVYYNATLLAAAKAEAGINTPIPPRTFGQWLEISQAVRAYGKKRGKNIAPIVSCYNVANPSFLLEQYTVAFTAGVEPKIDANLDGRISAWETYAGFVQPNSAIAFESERMRAFYHTYKRLMGEFADGYIAMTRQDAMFRFVQGDAAMIVTGSWDAKSLSQQAGDRFKLGAMQYPVPVRGDMVTIDGQAVDVGQFVAGPMNSAGATGGAGYGIYKRSKHPEVALDFLHFLTSVKNNGRFNAYCDWAPAVAGSELSDLVKPFMPDPEGYTSEVMFDLSADLGAVYEGKLAQFLTGELTYPQFAKAMTEAITNPTNGGDRAAARLHENDRTSVRNDERTLAAQTALAILGPEKAGAMATEVPLPTRQEAAERAKKILLQQVRKNNGNESRARFMDVRGKELQVR